MQEARAATGEAVTSKNTLVRVLLVLYALGSLAAVFPLLLDLSGPRWRRATRGASAS